MKAKTLMVIAAWLVCGMVSAEEVYRMEGALVTYENVDQRYAEAICRTVSAARDACRDLGFDMPETIKISANCDAKQRVRLFNDGKDRIYLTIRSEKNLLKPGASGIYHIYGLCHEVGHLAMYRVIGDHMWMSSGGAEGWAHYMGSRIVDSVYGVHGESLWPDAYDYSADGTRRLAAQIQAGSKSGVVKGAALWMELAELIGTERLAAVFKAWSGAKVDLSDPGAALRKTLLSTNDNAQLAAWWNRAEPVVVFKRAKSGFAARTAERSELQGQPMELFHDDGRQASKKSLAGGGHAVRFKVEGDSWYLTGVRIFGSRYGSRQAPRENFHVWLCDGEFNVIADFPQAYGKFKKGNPRWVNLATKATNVPSEFIVCAGFNPTGTKGVFVGMDGKGGDNSLTGLPGKEGRVVDEGDWMIRVRMDQLKSADSLKIPK